jgi:hypothetical protein
MNTNDGKLFYKDSSGVVQTMASKGTGSIGGSTTQVQFNNAGVLGGSASLTWSGTVLTSSGFAGPLNGTVGATTPAAGSFTTTTIGTSETLSYGTANGVGYLNGSKVLTTGSALTFDGTNLNIGSGTNTNSAKLLVNGLAQATDNTTYQYMGLCTGGVAYSGTASNHPYAFALNGAEQMRLNSTGLGIGTSSPTKKLDVYSTTQRGQIAMSGSNVVAIRWNTTDPNAGERNWEIVNNVDAQGALSFRVGASQTADPTTTRMAIDSSGSVLINTTTAVTGSKLVVASGDATIYGLTVGRGAGAVATNTAVGASALAANTSGATNVAIGYQAGQFNTTGNDNVSMGVNALRNTTTGSSNTALGRDALVSNTTASNNTAVGYQAGYSNTTGSAQVAVGYQALYANTTGSSLTAVGDRALQANTTGANNTAVGTVALAANTTGSNNTAMGYVALNAATTASNNVGIGYQAGKAVTTGNQNTILGMNASTVLTTGSDNTIVGCGAGENLATSSSNNVAIGRLALSNSGTRNDNTAVGYNAGGGITSGANNACFGVNAGNDAVRIISTGSNEGVFGNNSTTGLYVKVAWTVTSDIRDKTNIGVVPHGLDFVTKLNPIKYQYKVSREDDTPTGHVRYGFKAQEILGLEGDAPVIINNDDPANLKLTDQNLIAVLVNAIKELKAEVDSLKSQLKGA